MKTPEELRKDILALITEEEVKSYIQQHEEIWDLVPVTHLHITLLALAEVCSRIPGSFKQLINELK